MEKLKQKKIFILFLSLVLIISSASSFIYFSKNNPTIASDQTQTKPNYEKKDIEVPADIKEINQLSVLLIGYGGPGHQGGFLADVIQLAVADFKNSTIHLISIPRDLWLTLPNGKQAKINQILASGKGEADLVTNGAEQMKTVLSHLTGLEINYFVAVDFVGFQRAIGYNLGGITVNVPEALDDPWYPIRGEELNPCGYTPEEIAELTAKYSGFELESKFECRYEHLHYEPGPVEMEGGDALKYVRSRHGSAAGDFSRSQRQHAVLLGVRDRLFELDALSKIPAFFSDVNENINTDIDEKIISKLAPLLKLSQDYHVNKIILSTDNVLTHSKSANGQAILVSKKGLDSWQNVQSFIRTEMETNDKN